MNHNDNYLIHYYIKRLQSIHENQVSFALLGFCTVIFFFRVVAVYSSGNVKVISIYYTVKNIRISTGILRRVFHILTEPVPYASVYLRVQTHTEELV